MGGGEGEGGGEGGGSEGGGGEGGGGEGGGSEGEGGEGEGGEGAGGGGLGEGGGDGVTDLSRLRADVDALTERMTKPVPAPADAPVEAEASELGQLELPEQPTELLALLAERNAVEAEGVAVDAATAACLEMCADKERALCARIDELKSKAVEVEEELRKFKDLEAKTQQAGCDTNDVRAKLSICDSSLEQLQGELAACGEAMAEVWSLPEQLQQQVPRPPHPIPLTPPHPRSYPFATHPPSPLVPSPPPLPTPQRVYSKSPTTPRPGVARAPGAQRGVGGAGQGTAALRGGASRRAEGLRGSGGGLGG